ncbi:hypothetical protein F5884DRAFT_154889 [Xylogone sp. PMI_703]|nr:hypothetical protein F5884DRAFT_154889 [Xylogone sp. PMI_703]
MASTLGKRKREVTKASKEQSKVDSPDPDSIEQDAQEVFRRHFEAQFKPLPAVKRKQVKPIEVEPMDEGNSSADSEWEGISEEEGVQVIEHTEKKVEVPRMSKTELKAFMSSKPLRTGIEISDTTTKASKDEEEDAETEALNLKNDLALQRLLAESHLLDSSFTHTSKNRHIATDLRIQALGAKTSILKQEKMPMAHRKGIVAKEKAREEKRRAEARANGIILEKAKMKSEVKTKRDRGVDAPGVGKFRGGMLKLSKNDIRDIEGPKKHVAGKSGRGGKKSRGR